MRTAFELAPGILGNGPFLTAWGQGPTLAVATGKRQIALLNQDGIEQHSFRMDAPNVKGAASNKYLIAVHTISWSSDGTTLAVLPVASDFIYLWDTLSKRAQKGLMGAHAPGQEMKLACWSHDQPHLMIGTSKGTVLLFDASSMRVIQNITALHEQAITCGDFSGNIFCTAGEDKKIILTYDTGEHLATIAAEKVPLQALFSPTTSSNTTTSFTQLSVSDGKSLLISSVRALRDAAGSKATVKLEFDGCGDIISHAWCGTGTVIVAFQPGIVKLVSTLDSTIGKSQANLQLSTICSSAAFCKAISKIAVTGTRGVHIVNVGTQLTEIQSERLELSSGSVPSQVNWSRGGQLLAAGGSDGTLCCALGCLPNISAAAPEHYACLSTLTEVTIFDCLGTAVASVPIKFTPHFLALSSTTLAVGMNNQVYFYDLESYATKDSASRAAAGTAESGLEMKHTYDEGTAEDLAVNDSLAAALIGGRLIVHKVLEPGYEALVPYKGQDVTSFDLTEDFLILGTAAGLIQHYSVSEEPLAPLNEYRHTRSGKKAAICALWAAPGRAHLVFVDDAQKAFLFSAVDDQVLPLEGITSIVSKVVFYSEDPNVFMVIEQGRWRCFVYCPVTARGPEVRQIETVTPPVSCQPLVLSCGFAASQLDNGQVSRHPIGAVTEHDPHDDGYNAEAHTRQAIKVFHITEAVVAAAKASIPSLWQEVANSALHVLDINSAIAALREAGNASMVLSLERLRYTEDRYLLAGHVLALAEKDYDTAQGMFVRVNAEETALRMRKDLRHWSKAAQLATKCAPQEVTALQQRHAAALEVQGDVSAAHAMFQEALSSAALSDQDLIKSCKAGIARCTIRAGDARGGLQLALASGSRTAIRDCADLLATTGNLGTALEAGELYEAAGDSEQAVALYLEAKAFARAAPLMGNVKNRKLVLEFAAVREEQGQLAEAAVEYERGGDAESAVRLLLQAGNFKKALEMARRSSSPAAATLIVQHCLQESNWAGAVEFSILAGDYTSAWQVAQTHGEMDTYASSLGTNAPPEQHAQVAVCFQNIKEHFKAAEQFELAGNRLSAVSQYMAHAKKVSISEGDEATKRALSIISNAQPDDARRMARMVLSAADPTDHSRFADRFIELNLALGNTGAAISAAADSAVAYQCRGEYKDARKKLLDAAIRFRDGNAVPPALLAPLATLHSYILVKDALKLGNVSAAAQLLKRVAANLSSFDSTHAPQILASAALQCSAAGFSASAFDLAGELMHAQYREALKGMSSHKRKIEALRHSLQVRKTVAKEDPPEILVSCFWCGTRGPEFELNCAACQSVIPFCSASGKRMEAQSWRECPSCRFPGRAKELSLYIQQLGKCPMCQIDLSADDLIEAGAESKSQLPKLNPLQMERRHLVHG